ncbi:hypothetical protein ElyMa_005737700, partial [Elysia marginata]
MDVESSYVDVLKETKQQKDSHPKQQPQQHSVDLEDDFVVVEKDGIIVLVEKDGMNASCNYEACGERR